MWPSLRGVVSIPTCCRRTLLKCATLSCYKCVDATLLIPYGICYGTAEVQNYSGLPVDCQVHKRDLDKMFLPIYRIYILPVITTGCLALLALEHMAVKLLSLCGSLRSLTLYWKFWIWLINFSHLTSTYSALVALQQCTVWVYRQWQCCMINYIF